jgi:hypothetical protein
MLEDLYHTTKSSKRCFESLKKNDRILINQKSECCAHFPHDISIKQMHALSLLRAPTSFENTRVRIDTAGHYTRAGSADNA